MKYCISGIILLLLIVTAVFFSSGSSEDDKSKTEKIEKLMNYYHKKGEFNGTVLVCEKGEVIYKNAFGFANFRTNETLKEESQFYLASVSKQFTSMAIMILKEKNKLTYDDKLSKFFSDFPGYADSITIKHLMTHTSGIPDYFGLGLYEPNLTNRKVLNILTKQKFLKFRPGSEFSYSNSGYLLLAMIVERVTGTPYHKFAKENIFEPLGMNNTLVFDESKPSMTHRAIGHTKSGEINDYEILTVGDGGMYSTVEDLFLWDQALYTDKLVSKQTLDEAYSPILLDNWKLSYYGFGWETDKEGRFVFHGGSLAGFRTFIKRDLKTKSSYILLTNFSEAFAITDIVKALDDILSN